MPMRDPASLAQSRRIFQAALCSFVLGVLGAGAVTGEPIENATPPPLAEGRNGVVVGTTGHAAVHAGLQAVQEGGSAADAAAAIALTQVVECGGAYVTHAGILSMGSF